MSIVTEKRLKDRSNSKCEISGSEENLVVYLVAPKTEDVPENCILITKSLKDQIENPDTTNANDWRGLSDSMWNENLPVQIVSWRMLARLKNHDLLDMMYLDDEALEWAKATGEGEDEEGKIVHKDSNGNLWIGNNSGGSTIGGIGVLKYDGKEFISFTKQHQLRKEDTNGNSLDRVFSIGEDASGNIWFGTAESGVWRYDGNSVKNFTKKDGLDGDLIWIIYKSKTGELWFGGGPNGVYRFNGKSFERKY